MDLQLSHVFTANIFLIFTDATIGYYAAPALTRLAGGGEDGSERAVRGVRKLLAAVVTLYMFFNCLGFFEQKTWLLYFTSAVLAVDIAAQVIIFRKLDRRGR